jgi:hypothetical protein
MNPADATAGSPQAEGSFHTYHSSRIPWYVRLLWLAFWVFAVAYTVKYLFPGLQSELLAPP